MDYKDATALDILDALEKQFLVGEENKPVVKRDEKGRFAGSVVKGVKRGFRWVKGTYQRGAEKREGDQVIFASVCLVGGVRALVGDGAREPARDEGGHLRWFGYSGSEGALNGQPTGPGEEALVLLLEEVEALGHDTIPTFNDAHSTTLNDVIGLIRKAKERFWAK